MTATSRSTAMLAALALAAGLLLGGSARAAARIGIEDFLRSKGAAAFNESRFEDAIAAFEAMLRDYPDDPVILRYIGISYQRLGRTERAVDVFEKGLGIDPDNAALHFFLGIGAFELRDVERSRAAFARVIALAPDTGYGQRAQRYLAALNQQAATYEQEGAPRRWDLYLQLATQYDDNVRIAPGDSDSAVMAEYAAARYDILRRGHWQLRANVSTYDNQHLDGSYDSLDLDTVRGGVALAHSHTLFDRPITLRLRYGWQPVWIDQDVFSDSHRIDTSISINPTDATLTQLTHGLGFDHFRDNGFDSDVSDRDALVNTLDLSQYFFFRQRRHYVWASYRFEVNDADGVNFDFHAHQGGLGGSFALPFEFRLDVSGRYTYEFYHHFQGPIDRRANRLVVSGALSREIAEGLAFSLGYGYTDENSNYDALEYHRGVLSLNLGYRF